MNNNEERDKLLEVQSWLAEYEAVQNERLTSYRYQEMLIEISIIAFGIIIGLIVALNISSPALILTMSLICSSLGLLWLAENRRSLTCSNYISNSIAPALRELTGNPEIFAAESYKYEALYKQTAEKVLGNPASQGKGASPHTVQQFHKRLPARILSLGKLPGATFEFLIFFVPSLGGIGVAIYGMFSPEPWYWYCTALFIIALILTNALLITGRRWYGEWHKMPLVEESGSEAKL